MTLHFYWTYLETQKGPNYLYEQSFFVWCLMRQRNGGLNSGLKLATIVTDAYRLAVVNPALDNEPNIPPIPEEYAYITFLKSI